MYDYSCREESKGGVQALVSSTKKRTQFSLPVAAFFALALDKRLWQSFVRLGALCFDMVVLASYAQHMCPTVDSNSY